MKSARKNGIIGTSGLFSNSRLRVIDLIFLESQNSLDINITYNPICYVITFADIYKDNQSLKI